MRIDTNFPESLFWSKSGKLLVKDQSVSILVPDMDMPRDLKIVNKIEKMQNQTLKLHSIL